MKKTTKILIVIALVMTAISLNAQQNCGVVCHNGRLLTGVNPQAVEHHIGHGDTFITNDCAYVETGEECQSLSLPKLDFKRQIPAGLNYYIIDIYGRIYRAGTTSDNFKNMLPKGGVLFIKIEGYQVIKIINKN